MEAPRVRAPGYELPAKRFEKRLTEETGRLDRRITEEVSRLEAAIAKSQLTMIRWMVGLFMAQTTVIVGLFLKLKS